MTLSSWYNRCALTMIVLAILAYAAASRSPEFAVLAVPAVFAFWKLSNRRAGRFLLPRYAVNILLIAVLGYALVRSQGSLNVVETVAQVVVLIQIIKTGDRRTPRDDAQILCLAVFLAIAAMLDSNDVWTGALLIAFLPVLILTVMLYQLYQGAFHADAARIDGAPAWATAKVGGLRRGLRMTTGGATLGTIALALVVFVLLPRGVGENAFGNFGVPQQRRETGFSPSVTLGAKGIISTSPTVVMDLVVRDHVGQNIGSIDSVHYLRGAVLTVYENRKWTSRTESNDWQEYPNMDPGEIPIVMPPRQGPEVEQTITMRSGGRPDQWSHLFATWRPVTMHFGRTGQFRHGKSSYVLFRKSEPGPFEYTVRSVIYEPARDGPQERTPVSFESESIGNLARAIVTKAGLDPDPLTRPFDDDPRVARAIQDHLRSNYTYTLEQESPPRDTDPVEFFLFDRKMGHCEYFASAMVLLCRTVGVNARMVTGYIATEFSPTTGSYVVRESNAHAWVEAEDGGRRWRRYDPTPPDDLARIHKPTLGILGRLRNALDAVEYAWNSSIVAFNEHTRQGILGPTRGERVGWLGRIEQVSLRLRHDRSGLLLRSVVNGGLTFMAVASGCFVLVFLSRMIPSLALRLGTFRPSHEPQGGPGYYRSLLRALSRRGLAKPHWRPPLAHAEALRDVDADLAAEVGDVVQAYYAERFSGQPLDRRSRAGIRGVVKRLGRARR